MGNKINMIGFRSGKLTVTSEVKERSRGDIYWECKCDCGAIKQIRGADLRNFTTKSCGCLQSNAAIKSNKNRAKNSKSRFHSYYSKQKSGCWEWQNYLDKDGYGQFVEKESKPVKAHRFSYELHIGNIPEDLLVCHTCDNPKCVNPNHLFLGTHQDNMNDMKAKGRQSRRGNPKNEKGQYYR